MVVVRGGVCARTDVTRADAHRAVTLPLWFTPALIGGHHHHIDHADLVGQELDKPDPLVRSPAGSSLLFKSRLAGVVDQDRDLYAVGDVELVEKP